MYIDPPVEARSLAMQLDYAMQRAGFNNWQLCGVADRKLVASLERDLKKAKAVPDALAMLGLNADIIFARIREDIERGLIEEAREHLNFVDAMTSA